MHAAYRVLVIRLDLDAGIRREVRNDQVLERTYVVSLVLALDVDVVIEGVQVRRRDEEPKVRRVAGVELDGVRCPLRARPEWRSRRRHRVLGEVEQKLLDRVVVLPLKEHAGPADAVLKRQGPVVLQIVSEHL